MNAPGEIRYGAFDIEMQLVARDTLIVRSRTGAAPRLVRAPETPLLLACRITRTLDDHIDACSSLPDAVTRRLLSHTGLEGRNLRQDSNGSALRQTIQAYLERFVREGLLTSEQDLLDRLSGGTTTRSCPGLTTVGVPTRDRTESLTRCFRSFLENAVRHGRSATYIVMDDSESPAVNNDYRRALSNIAKEGTGEFRYANRHDRARFARCLSTQAGVPEDITRFALLGDPRYSTRYGAVRNALLLDTLDELSLQVDDDFICTPAQPPGHVRELEILPVNSPNQYWFGETLEEVRSLVETTNVDFLAEHEAYLGCSPVECIAAARRGGLEVRISNPASLGALLNSEARVVTSFAGVVGDIGGPGRHHGRLGLTGNAHGLSASNHQRYRDRLYSRQLVKSPVRHTVTLDHYAMAGNMGIDGRVLVPPFMPVLVAEDVVFGICRHSLLPYSCSAFLPYTIVHDPPGDRATGQPVPLQLITNVVISTLLEGLGDHWPAAGPVEAMRGFGAYLRSLGTWKAGEFCSYIEEVVGGRLMREADYLEQEIARRSDAPPVWQETARESVEERRRLALSDGLASPPDLPGDTAERQRLFQDLLRRFGDVVTHWPEIRQAAAELRLEGHRISSTL